MTILLALIVVLSVVFMGGILVYVTRFMANLVDKNHEHLLELSQATTDRVTMVVRETARAVSEVIAPVNSDVGAMETNVNADEVVKPGELENVPWFLQQDGKFGVDPTDAMDEWITGLGADVGRVANIRPGEDILPGPDTPTGLPGLAQPNMSGENA